jgi:hypothetical protein
VKYETQTLDMIYRERKGERTARKRGRREIDR